MIAPKFGKYIDEQNNIFGRYPNERALVDSIGKECEASLRRLKTDYIDIYQFHEMGEYTLLRYAEEVIEILENLVFEGKIRYYGWSTINPECARVFARGEHCSVIQHSLNILKYIPNSMYTIVFLILYFPGLIWQSGAALMLALAQHAFVWFHYFCTEKPDMKEIYGPR